MSHVPLLHPQSKAVAAIHCWHPSGIVLDHIDFRRCHCLILKYMFVAMHWHMSIVINRKYCLAQPCKTPCSIKFVCNLASSSVAVHKL